MAVKVIERQVDLKYLDREMRIQFACDHPNILKLYGVSNTPHGETAFILEYAETTYFELIKRGVHLSNHEKFTIIRELADALLYIHRHGFIHRDLKVGARYSSHFQAENILISNNHIKIGDFGFARELKSVENIHITPLGTPVMCSSWRVLTCSIAPELLLDVPVTNKVDVYSFGSVLNEIMSDRINYWDLNVTREKVNTYMDRGFIHSFFKW